MAATTLADRAIVRLSGPDARDFLQGLVTSDVAGALPTWAGLLTPQGKCLFDFIVWPDPNGGEDILIDCEADAADDLVKRLSLYRLRRKIDIALDESLAVHWSPSGGAGSADPRLGDLGNRGIDAPGEAVNGWHEHRLRLGVCEGRTELGDILWLECNAIELNGVSFTKGCFVGQENTARMNWRSKINRRLVVVPAGGPGPRTRIFHETLGLAVDHRRLDDLDGAIVPRWLAEALKPAEQE
jgi:tRNA-modifying protein YgfZ